jgi:hypothetical protein
VPALPPRRLVSTGLVALAVGVVVPIVSPAAASADPKSDPPGNNGTIKIDPYGATEGHANHPHPGCNFRLQLFGFDDDQTGTITFVGQAPTKDAVTKQPLSGTQLLSDDKARGGQDVDAFFDVHGADLGLTGTPAKQGFHIKVLVNADDAPGGAKSKVFWLDCPAPAPAPAPATSGTTEGAATAPTTTSTTSSTSSTTSSSTSTTDRASTTVQGMTSGAATADTTSTTTDVQDTELLATTRGSAVRSATLAAAGEAAPGSAAVGSTAGSGSSGRTGIPGALAFTGLPSAALAGLGLLVLALGTLAVVAGRRRTTPVLED